MLSSSSSVSESGSFVWTPHNFVEEDGQMVNMDNYNYSFSGKGVSNDDELVLKLDNIGFPSCYHNFDKIIKPHVVVMVVGSCNGLICLRDKQSNEVSLWNPATRQFRILPKSITFDGDCLHHRFFAFGFDAKTKDYKVVLLSGLRLRPRIIDGVSVGPMECLCRVQVYSSSTDSWRFLEGINVLPGSPLHYPPDSSPGLLLYLNGSCFFLAKFLYPEHCIPPEDNDRFIISLDLTKETITPIQLKDHWGSQELYLCYLDDKLALFTARNMNRGPDCWEIFDILVLNEYCSPSSNIRNYESWTKLHAFRIRHGTKLHAFRIRHGFPGERIIPRGISNDGVFVFLETGIHGHGLDKKKMKLCNLVTDEVNKNFIYSDQVLSEACAYKPSLVSIIGGNGSSYGI